MSAGQETVGGTVSRTIILKEQVEFKSALSVAVQFTVVVVDPLNRLPEGGIHVRLLIPELSLALGVGL
jgi:hypothetical protein